MPTRKQDLHHWTGFKAMELGFHGGGVKELGKKGKEKKSIPTKGNGHNPLDGKTRKKGEKSN